MVQIHNSYDEKEKMKEMRRKVAICIILCLLLGLPGSGSSQAVELEQVKYQNIIQEESEYLVSLQLDNGCYPMTSYSQATDGRVQMSPYFAEFSALALLESGQTYMDSVRKYLDWHFAHLNTEEEDVNGVAGTIYDYWEYVDTDTNHVEKEVVFTQDGKKFYDSTDSYAALYLKVLFKYLEVSGDETYLRAHKEQIDSLIEVLQNTMDDGLSIATPSFETQYLMDNAEVIDGLTAGISLYQAVFSQDSVQLEKMQQMCSQIQNRILTTMWHQKQGGYYDSMLEKQESGQFESPDFSWGTFYMDATSQLYLITNGVLEPESDRAKLLYENFNCYWDNGTAEHNWTSLDIPDEYYWGEIAYCGALMGDKKRVNQYLRTYEKKVSATKHAYPLYNGDAANVILAAAEMEKIPKISYKLT